jgi:hypothetical protein
MASGIDTGDIHGSYDMEDVYHLLRIKSKSDRTAISTGRISSNGNETLCKTERTQTKSAGLIEQPDLAWLCAPKSLGNCME